MVLVDLVGRVPAEKALLNLIQPRYGRKVTSTALARYARQSEGMKRAIENYFKKIEGEQAVAKKPAKIALLERKAEVLRILLAAGRRVHASELAAALAWQHGLRREPLLSYINAAAAKGMQRFYEGSLHAVMHCLGKDLLHRTHEVLKRGPRMLSSEELARELGYAVPSEAKQREKLLAKISVALGVLDLMGLSYKLPTVSSKKGAAGYSWVHSDYSGHSITVPKENVDFKILVKLFEKPSVISELSLPHVVKGAVIGSPSGVAVISKTSSALSRLQETGLVEARRVKLGRTTGLRYYLGQGVRELLEDTLRKRRLNPALRAALLGEPFYGLKPFEQHMLAKIARWSRTAKTLEENPGLNFRKVAEKLGENFSYVRSIASLGRKPWARVKPTLLREKYVPELARKDPELGEWFAKQIKMAERISS